MMKIRLTTNVRAYVVETAAGSKKTRGGRQGRLEAGAKVIVPSGKVKEHTGGYFFCDLSNGLRVEGTVFPGQYEAI